MSDIKIFVTHTPNRDSIRVEHPYFYHVIAGSDFQTKKAPKGVYLDNQGENISYKNKSYCELTTQYWAWKNLKADYYGFCHYRRFFSFQRKQIKESDWGTIEYDYLDEKTMEELHFDEAEMRSFIETYDFLIAKGIKTDVMNAKTVYDHYEKAPELHIKDVTLFLDIIREKYTYLSETAEDFFKGKIFYPCNMFIMKKEIFDKYSQILFDLLGEFEKRADFSGYSREGYRTIGHLGERMAGIYYLYLQKQGNYRLGETQIALIHNVSRQPEEVVELPNGTIPVVLAANEKYVPVLYTCVQSVVEHTSAKRNYEIYVFHTDITADSRQLFKKRLNRNNVKIHFINVSKKVSGYRLQAKEHITTETFYRFLILDFFKHCTKVIYLDCDMIVCQDVAQLYDTEMGNCLIAATLDPDFAGQCNLKNSDMRQYCLKTLGIENPYTYFQAGVLVFQVQEMKKAVTVSKLLEMSDTGIYRFSDQDILNIVCKGRVVYLDMAWNMIFDCDHFRWQNVIKYAPYEILDAYENARKEPYIIHYAGFLKPWMKPDEDFGYVFWDVARRTPYYEQLLKEMCHPGGREMAQETVVVARAFQRTRRLLMYIFPQGSAVRRVLGKLYWRIFG